LSHSLGRFEAFSYLPELQDESSRRKRGRRKKRYALQEENLQQQEDETDASKKAHGGTESDLRKLTNPEQIQILRKLGYEDYKIAKLSRWDRNYIIKTKASGKNGATILGGLLAKFARQTTKVAETTAAEREFYQSRIDAIFERGCNTLSSELDLGNEILNVIDSDDEDTDGDDEFEKDLDAGLMAMTTAGGQAGMQSAKEMTSHEEANELQKLTRMLHKDDTTTTTTTATTTTTTTTTKPNTTEHETKSNERRIPAPMGWRPYDVLKRTIIEKGANGQTIVKVEYVKTPKRVRLFKNEELKKQALRYEQLEQLRSAAAGAILSKDDMAKARRKKEKTKSELAAGEQLLQW